MRGRFDTELVSLSQWFIGRTPVRKTGDLKFKSQLTHNFFPLNIYHISYMNSELGAKGDWDFRISGSGQIPLWN